MKIGKLFVILAMICLLCNCMFVSAENISRVEDISMGETKVITVPQPEGEVDEGYLYFTQLFIFTPEISGTYRFLTDYTQDETTPYDIFMDVVPFGFTEDGSRVYLDNSGYLEVENGCEFEAQAGICYELCFQYPTHDGRYPEFRFYLESDDVPIPKTADAGLLLPMGLMLFAAGGILLATTKRKSFQ